MTTTSRSNASRNERREDLVLHSSDVHGLRPLIGANRRVRPRADETLQTHCNVEGSLAVLAADASMATPGGHPQEATFRVPAPVGGCKRGLEVDAYSAKADACA